MGEMEERIASLSQRQFQVMLGVARRLSSKEIGAVLNLSPATVDSHIAAALLRLQLTSRRDAGVWLEKLGYLTGAHPADAPFRERLPGGHHGGNLPPNSPPYPRKLYTRIWYVLRNGGRNGLFRRSANDRSSQSGMARAVGRFLLDGFYIILIFGIMSGVAFGAHWVVIQCEHQQIDPVVLWILRVVSYLLAGLDAIGVVTATGFLTFRFIRAIVRADA